MKSVREAAKFQGFIHPPIIISELAKSFNLYRPISLQNLLKQAYSRWNIDIINRIHSLVGDYIPGEAEIINNPRPHTWTIEWDGNEGLDPDAYDTLIRSPYIQNVTETSATVLWRVSIPKGENPADYAKILKARSWIAGKGTHVTEGQLYETGSSSNEITTKDVTWTYQYKDGVKFNHDYDILDNIPVSGLPSPIPGLPRNGHWLNSMFDRPVIEFKVIFKNLMPREVYHYRIISQGIVSPNDTSLKDIVLANDIYFKTAPSQLQKQSIRFVAMGDFGPGDDKPSYFYDVFDQFHSVSRKFGPNLWLALGDIDNDTDGHPNAMDPFFFMVYNAFHNRNNPQVTSSITEKAENTTVKAFRKPPYYGLLGGLPVYPTYGNHDVCSKYSIYGYSSLKYLKKAYMGSFVLPYNNNIHNFQVYTKTGIPASLEYDKLYALKEETGGYIKYGEREYGINLVWSKTPSYEWKFQKQGATGEITPDDKVMLFNTMAKDYVVYAEREYGINLKWRKDTSNSDAHNWKIIQKNEGFLLFNTTSNEYLVYGKREYGINLVWLNYNNCFYSFKYGNVLYVSLGIPKGDRDECDADSEGIPGWDIKYENTFNTSGPEGEDDIQIKFLKNCLKNVDHSNTWVVVYFHDHNQGYKNITEKFSRLLAYLGIDIVLMGHEHFFADRSVFHKIGNMNYDYRAIVIGTGGFGDTDTGDYCHRPGFAFFNVDGMTMEYWKYDTHDVGSNDEPLGRDALDSRIKEYRRVEKYGKGQHNVVERMLDIPVE